MKQQVTVHKCSIQRLRLEINVDAGEDVGEEGEPASTSEYTEHWLARRDSADRVDRRKLGRANAINCSLSSFSY